MSARLRVSLPNVYGYGMDYLSLPDLKTICSGLNFARGQRPKTRKNWLDAAVAHGLVTPDQAAAKVKRADVATKRSDQKNCRQFCRVVTLQSLFAEMEKAAKEKALAEVDSIVGKVSRIAEQRSLFVNAYLTDLLDNDAPGIRKESDRVARICQGIRKAKAKKVKDGGSSSDDAVAEQKKRIKSSLPDVRDGNATFFRNCFTVGVTNCTTQNKNIQSKLQEWAQYFPCLEAPRHVGNVMTAAAQKYHTVFTNHLTLYDGMRQRIRRYFVSRLLGAACTATDNNVDDEEDDDEVENSSLYANVTAALKIVLEGLSKNKDGNLATKDDVTALAREVRADLNLTDDAVKLTDSHLKENIWRAMLFVKKADQHFAAERVSMMMLTSAAAAEGSSSCRFRKGAGRGLKLAPMHKRQALAVQIDGTDWQHLATKHMPTLFEGVHEDLRADVAVSFLRKAVRKKFGDTMVDAFTGTITTDGVTASLHFSKALSQDALQQREEARAAKYRTREQQKADEKKAAEARKNREPRPVPDLVLTVDTGRVQPMHVCVVYKGQPFCCSNSGGKKMQFKLTAGAYYTQSGVRRRQRLLRKMRRRSGLEAVDRRLARTCRTRSTSLQDILDRAAELARDSDIAWKFAMRRKVRGFRFRNKVGKTRVQDHFFRRIKRELSNHFSAEEIANSVMVFGDAKFEASGKGNAPVPTIGSLEERASRWFRVEKCSEYGTSTGCAKCARQGKTSYLFATRLRTLGCPRFVDVRHDKNRPLRSVRHGLVNGIHSKRLVKRIAACKKSTVRTYSKTRCVQNWAIDGHSGETEEQKAAASAARKDDGAFARYARGLRFCPECQETRDRDEHGADGIFVHYKCDCGRLPLPLVYEASERKRLAAAKRAAQQEKQQTLKKRARTKS